MRLLILAAGLTALTWAQEAVNYASVSGRVTDPSGAAIEGAPVTAVQTETNLASTTATDREGHFRFSYLRAGGYEIRVWQRGFAEFKQRMTLSVGAAFDVPVALVVESQGTSVAVYGEGAALETARTQVAATITNPEVRSLPLNGRNFLDLALLAPGVSPTNTASNQLFAETSAVPGQGFSVGSQRNFSNNFIVDGLSANDDAAGLSGVFYSLDAVEEFQVVTAGAQAELGRALGGYINMITRSGTNSFHGDLYGYFRNQRLNAANPLSNTKLPSTHAQYGASAAGPIVRDRSFYFANFEQRRWNQSGLVTIAPSNAEAINARLRETGYPGPQIGTGLYPNPVNSLNLLAKADHQFRANDQFSARYSVYRVASEQSRGAGALNAVSASAGLENADHTVAFGNVATLSPRTVNETRGQFTYSHLRAPATDAIGPAVAIAGVATFGTLSGSPTSRINRLYEIVDNLSHQSGAHSVKAGADFLYNDLAIGFPRAVRGSYTFSSLASFLSGVYNNTGFTQTFGNSSVSQANPNIGMYVQDEWKVNPHLTLNAGLRYDLQFLRSIATDTNNVSPRAGFAWSPGARRTVVRGNFGLFYDRVPLRALANALLSSGNTTALTEASQISVSLSPGQAGAPIFPNILPGSTAPAGVTVNFTTMDRHIRNAYSVKSGLEIEHQLGENITVSAGYQHLRGLHLISAVNQNPPACAAAGSNNGCRPNGQYGNDSRYSSAGDSTYDGLHVSFVQRPAKWSSYRVSYAWSKALDNVGEFFFSSPIDNYDIWRDYGRSDDDQRHRLTFDGAVHSSLAPSRSTLDRFTHGFQLSGMLQYYSALPLNISSGVTTVQGTAGRPTVNGGFIGRNTGIGNDFFGVSARVSRTFALREGPRLEAIAEAFNVLNHRNNLAKNGTFGLGAYPTNPAAAFGQVTAVNEARSLQLALRLRF